MTVSAMVDSGAELETETETEWKKEREKEGERGTGGREDITRPD